MTNVAPSGSQKAQSVTLEKPASIHSAVFGKGARKIAAQLEMIANALDSVEVGDVERRRVADGEKGAGDGDRIPCGPKRRLDRPVCGALAAAGMDHRSRP